MNKMKTFQVVGVLMCWMIVSTFGTQECESTIKRSNYVDYAVHVTVCCYVRCNPGFFVDVCKVNGTADRCKPCPEGTYLDDITDSEFPVKCRINDCPPESIPASTFPPKPACQKKCVCDVQRQYVGSDPCACEQATVTCPHGKSLTIDNTCEPIEKEVTPTSNDPSSTGYFMTTQEENPEYTGRALTKETTVNPNDTVPSYDPGPKGDNDLVTIHVSLPVLVIMFIVVLAPTAIIGVFWYKKRKENTFGMRGEIDRNGVPENIPLHTMHLTRTEYNAPHIVKNGSVKDANENYQFDQKEKTNSDEELENTSLKSLSPHPTRTESIIASYSFENESVNSYSRIFTERSDEEMESSSLMLHNTHPTKTANNPSSIMGNVNSERKMIDNGRDAMENYQSDLDLGYAQTLSPESFNKDKGPLSYDLESVEPLSKPEEMPI